MDAVGVEWRKSSRCGTTTCVEVAPPGGDGVVRVRDAKDPGGSVHEFSAEDWQGFVAGVQAGVIGAV